MLSTRLLRIGRNFTIRSVFLENQEAASVRGAVSECSLILWIALADRTLFFLSEYKTSSQIMDFLFFSPVATGSLPGKVSKSGNKTVVYLDQLPMKVRKEKRFSYSKLDTFITGYSHFNVPKAWSADEEVYRSMFNDLLGRLQTWFIILCTSLWERNFNHAIEQVQDLLEKDGTLIDPSRWGWFLISLYQEASTF